MLRAGTCLSQLQNWWNSSPLSSVFCVTIKFCLPIEPQLAFRVPLWDLEKSDFSEQLHSESEGPTVPYTDAQWMGLAFLLLPVKSLLLCGFSSKAFILPKDLTTCWINSSQDVNSRNCSRHAVTLPILFSLSSLLFPYFTSDKNPICFANLNAYISYSKKISYLLNLIIFLSECL